MTMEKTLKLLLATDYSESVMNAERYAFQLAQSRGFPLVMMHVDEKGAQGTMKDEDTDLEDLHKLERRRDEIMHALKIEPGEINCDCIVKKGNATSEIIKAAAAFEVDFICMGAHGITGYRDVFFGGHSWDVIKRSDVPVLTIPKEALFTGINHFVFATEYRDGELPVLNYLAQVADFFNAELTVLHVTNYILTREFEKEMFSHFAAEVKAKIPYPKLSIRLINNDDVTEGLNKYCTERKVDWLVMSPERPFLLGRIFNAAVSATRKMSFHLEVPLLTIPDYYNSDYAKFWRIYESGMNVEEGI